jgi:hypothetical protein
MSSIRIFIAPASMPPSASFPSTRPTTGGADTAGEAGRNHLFQHGGGADGHAAGGIWFGFALHQAGNFFELPTNLVDHLVCGPPDRGHGEGSDAEWDDPPDKSSGDDISLGQTDHAQTDSLRIRGVKR